MGGVDELIGKALRDRLDVAEGSIAGTLGQQSDGLGKKKSIVKIGEEMIPSKLEDSTIQNESLKRE